MDKKIKLYCAVPSTGTVADAQAFFWREAEKKYADSIEFIWPAVCVRRIFHDFARNAHVENFLESGADILFFLDSDVVPCPDMLDIVLEHEKWHLAGAPYPVFMTPGGCERPQVLFTVYKGRNGSAMGAANVPSSGIDYVDGLATGCLFIKREVLQKMQAPYFEFKFNENTRQMTEGEDLGFCRKAADLGYKFYVDYSKCCKHYKTVCLLEVNNYAMDYSRRSVETYANMIKPLLQIVSDKVKAAKEKDTKKILSTNPVEQLRGMGIIKV